MGSTTTGKNRNTFLGRAGLAILHQKLNSSADGDFILYTATSNFHAYIYHVGHVSKLYRTFNPPPSIEHVGHSLSCMHCWAHHRHGFSNDAKQNKSTCVRLLHPGPRSPSEPACSWSVWHLQMRLEVKTKPCIYNSPRPLRWQFALTRGHVSYPSHSVHGGREVWMTVHIFCWQLVAASLLCRILKIKRLKKLIKSPLYISKTNAYGNFIEVVLLSLWFVFWVRSYVHFGFLRLPRPSL